jgi:hypothetical protein
VDNSQRGKMEKINAKKQSIAEGNIALHVEPDNP